jgi:surfeit locus 1 family protein
MRIGRFEFTPGLWPTLATLALLPLLCSLGYWQIDRAAAKRELLDGYAQHSHAVATSVDAAAAFDLAQQYHHVRITGRYDVQHQFLLDNQVRDGVAGYQVFTPLLLADERRAILVNRGWLALGASRRHLPALPTPEGPVTITGVLAPLPGYGMLLGADIEADKHWPRVVQAIELARLQRDLSAELAPQIVLLDAAGPDGFMRQRKIVEFGPERNLGYAFQWFTMALAVLTIYIGVNTRRRARRAGE